MSDGYVSLSCLAFCLPLNRFSKAVRTGDVEFLEELLARDPALACQRLAWHTAAQKGHVEILRALAVAVRTLDPFIISPSLLASSNRNPNFTGSVSRATARSASNADELLKQVVGQCSPQGITPLMTAAHERHEAAVAFLLDAGADRWQCDECGLSALHHAARSGCAACIQELLKGSPVPSGLACHLVTPQTRFVDCLDKWGCTPLMWSVHGHTKGAASALLMHDANIIAMSRGTNRFLNNLPSGLTALHIAASQGNLSMIKLLLVAYYESAGSVLPSHLDPAERRRRQNARPDPRMVGTRAGRLPVHLAFVHCQHHVLPFLDPSVPLATVLEGIDVSFRPQAGINNRTLQPVPRLAVLAAAALHSSLSKDLRNVERQLIESESLALSKDNACVAGASSSVAGASSCNSRPFNPRRTESAQVERIIPPLDERRVPPLDFSRLEKSVLDLATHEMDNRGRNPEICLPQTGADIPRADGSNGSWMDACRQTAQDTSEAIVSTLLSPRQKLMSPRQTCLIHEGSPALMSPRATVNKHNPECQPGQSHRGTHLRDSEVLPPLNSGQPQLSTGAVASLEEDQSDGGIDLGQGPQGDHNGSLGHSVHLLLPPLVVPPLLEMSQGSQQASSHLSGPLTLAPASGSSSPVQSGTLVHNSPPSPGGRRSHRVHPHPLASSPSASRKSSGLKESEGGDHLIAIEGENVLTALASGPGPNPLNLQWGGWGHSCSGDITCPVCLDSPASVLLRNCQHRLCIICAKDMCKRHTLTPALCPYCRAIIGGFCLA